jgi:hypothetical protein
MSQRTSWRSRNGGPACARRDSGTAGFRARSGGKKHDVELGAGGLSSEAASQDAPLHDVFVFIVFSIEIAANQYRN